MRRLYILCHSTQVFLLLIGNIPRRTRWPLGSTETTTKRFPQLLSCRGSYQPWCMIATLKSIDTTIPQPQGGQLLPVTIVSAAWNASLVLGGYFHLTSRGHMIRNQTDTTVCSVLPTGHWCVFLRPAGWSGSAWLPCWQSIHDLFCFTCGELPGHRVERGGLVTL